MQNILREKLIEYWIGTLTCNLCKLPGGFAPQFRPVGHGYRIGGLAFIQINPGEIGSLTDSQIQQKYRVEANRKKATDKNNATKLLRNIQEEFIKLPSSETWDNLCNEYFKVMRTVWGWPPGRYAKTIESHGVRIENVAVINLAQCPVQNNDYKTSFLDKCWGNHTSKLISILRPRILVAQGKTVQKYLQDNCTISGIIIVEGVHHASRSRNAERNILFENAKQLCA